MAQAESTVVSALPKALPQEHDDRTSMQKLGLPLAILSNGTPEMLDIAVKSAGMSGLFDHILSVADLKEKYGAKACIHEADADALTGGRISLSALMGMGVKRCAPDMLLKGGETLDCAGFTVKVLHTPCHSKGSVCYVLEQERIVFSGDTLFHLSIGRTDLPGGDADELYSSIAYCLFRLEGEYEVYPGHMDKTSLDYERQRNPFVNRWSPDTW